MLTPRLTNCQDCHKIPDLLKKIDCKLAELGNDMYNNISFMLGNDIPATTIMQLMAYKRILTFKYCNPYYAGHCSVDDIAGKVIRLTSGCVSRCNEPTVCEITTCCVDVIPNPTTTTTSTSSTSTTTTTSTSTSSTTTTTTTINCTFTGEIICPVTTTTTTTAEPTTTTTTAYPGVAPCTWSTNGGNPGEIAVYDFDTNLSTAVLVPNDFLTTQGINRPICSTGDKLWMASVVENTVDPSNNSFDVVYIREWDINTTGFTPTLSYVREITILTGNLIYRNTWGTIVSTIAVTADNNTLLVGFGAKNSGSNSMGVYSWDISTSGDIVLNESNEIEKRTVSFGNTYGIITELTGMFITNDNNVILSCRYYEDASAINVGNYVKQYQGLPSEDWTTLGSSWISLNLQSLGVPEFTTSWTNPSKAMPLWGVNGLLQVIQPETLEVYNINQTTPYNITLDTTVADSDVWIHTSTGCANVEIELPFADCTATWIPALTEIVDGEYVYTGPATFTYEGISVTASAQENVNAINSGDTVGGIPAEGCSGISNPAATDVVRIIQGNNFSITLTFSQPVNNIPIRAAVLNTTSDFSSGDVYEFNTNSGTPSISISAGCNVQVQGNKIGGGVPDYNTSGDGEFVITAPSDYTILTITGNAPTGGPLLLGCLSDAPTTTTTTTSSLTTTTTTTLPSGVNTIWTWFESETPV